MVILGCKPSPNPETPSIYSTSGQPLSHKMILAPVVILQCCLIIFLNFYLNIPSSWSSDSEKYQSPHQGLQRPMLFAPHPWPSISDPISCIFPHHSTPATLNWCPQAHSHLGGYAPAVFSTQEAPSPDIHGACSSDSFEFLLKCKLLTEVFPEFPV